MGTLRRLTRYFRGNDDGRKPPDRLSPMDDDSRMENGPDVAQHRFNQERKPMQSPIASKTYGTVSADKQKEMSGLEFVQGLVDGTLPLNIIAQTRGYDILPAGDR